MVADRLHEGKEARRELALGANAGQDLGAARFGPGYELGYQPAPADPGVPRDEDRPAGAFSRRAQLLLEQRQLACAADQDWTEDALAHPFQLPSGVGTRAS